MKTIIIDGVEYELYEKKKDEKEEDLHYMQPYEINDGVNRFIDYYGITQYAGNESPAWWIMFFLVAPDWAKYIAMNRNGIWQAFEEKPLINETRDTWKLLYTSKFNRTQNISWGYKHPDWKKSLISRNDIPEQYRRK